MEMITRVETALLEWIQTQRVRDGKSSDCGGEVFMQTDCGPERESNQDLSIFARINSRDERAILSVAIVADGMGGMAKGEEAAAIAASAFCAFIAADRNHSGLRRLARAATEYANSRVADELHGHGGTTFSCVLFSSFGATGINVGDSRIYIRSNNLVKRVTVDDSFAEQLNAIRNRFVPEGENPHLRDNRLLQFIGLKENLEPHSIEIPPCDGVFITTDGAHFAGDELMTALGRSRLNSTDIAKALVQLSRAAGSTDNATVLAIENPDGVSKVDTPYTIVARMPGSTFVYQYESALAKRVVQVAPESVKLQSTITTGTDSDTKVAAEEASSNGALEPKTPQKRARTSAKPKRKKQKDTPPQDQEGLIFKFSDDEK